jgi:hypothetical protein
MTTYFLICLAFPLELCQMPRSVHPRTSSDAGGMWASPLYLPSGSAPHCCLLPSHPEHPVSFPSLLLSCYKLHNWSSDFGMPIDCSGKCEWAVHSAEHCTGENRCFNQSTPIQWTSECSKMTSINHNATDRQEAGTMSPEKQGFQR